MRSSPTVIGSIFYLVASIILKTLKTTHEMNQSEKRSSCEMMTPLLVTQSEDVEGGTKLQEEEENSSKVG